MNSTLSTPIRSAMLSLIALGVVVASNQAFAAKGDNEKCAGIVKAGKNDCGTSRSACVGSIKTDSDAEAWVYLPKGACEKIVGGRIQTSQFAMPGGKK